MNQLSILLFTLLTLIGRAEIINGTVISAVDKKPVAYVNIGIAGKGTGTVSDSNGKFTIILPDSLLSESLKFSCIGYKNQSVKVRDLIKSMTNNTADIILHENIFSLSQVVVKPKNLKTKVVGNKNNNKNASAGFRSNDLGSELGTIMKIKKAPAFIENVNFNIAQNDIPNAKFRVNIYSVKNNLPDSILLKQPIYITTSLSSGTLSLDMRPYNIWVNGDFMVSLEWIENYETSKLHFCVGLMDSNSLWRKTSQDTWQKSTPVGIGFNSTVTYEK